MKLFVIGAGSAIAQAITKAAIHEIDQLWLLVRSRNSIESLLAIAQKNDVEVQVIEANAFSKSDLQAFAESLKHDVQPTHVLMAWGILTCSEASRDELQEMENLNHHLSLAWAKVLFSAGKTARPPVKFALLSSLAACRLRPSNWQYGRSKARLEADLLTLESQNPGIELFVIQPGPIFTPMTENLEKLPLGVAPDIIAEDILRAWSQGKRSLQTPRRWRFLMPILLRLPEFIWKRLN